MSELKPFDNLLDGFVELNWSNYGQQEVEALQAWAFEAYDRLKELKPVAWKYVERTAEGHAYRADFSATKWAVIPDGYTETPLFE